MRGQGRTEWPAASGGVAAEILGLRLYRPVNSGSIAEFSYSIERSRETIHLHISIMSIKHSGAGGRTVITIERGETIDDALQFPPALELGDAGDNEAAEDGMGKTVITRILSTLPKFRWVMGTQVPNGNRTHSPQHQID